MRPFGLGVLGLAGCAFSPPPSSRPRLRRRHCRCWCRCGRSIRPRRRFRPRRRPAASRGFRSSPTAIREAGRGRVPGDGQIVTRSTSNRRRDAARIQEARVHAVSDPFHRCSQAMRSSTGRTPRCGTSASRRSSRGSPAAPTSRYFFSVGNHDVTTMPPGDPGRGHRLAQHAVGDVEADSAGRIAPTSERLSDIRVRLRQRVRHRDRLEHRQRSAAARVGERSARASRSHALPARDRLLSSPAVLVGAASAAPARQRRRHRAADRRDPDAVHAAVPDSTTCRMTHHRPRSSARSLGGALRGQRRDLSPRQCGDRRRRRANVYLQGRARSARLLAAAAAQKRPRRAPDEARPRSRRQSAPFRGRCRWTATACRSKWSAPARPHTSHIPARARQPRRPCFIEPAPLRRPVVESIPIRRELSCESSVLLTFAAATSAPRPGHRCHIRRAPCRAGECQRRRRSQDLSGPALANRSGRTAADGRRRRRACGRSPTCSTWARPAAACGRPRTTASPGRRSPMARLPTGSIGAIDVSDSNPEHDLRRARAARRSARTSFSAAASTSRPMPDARGSTPA